MSTEQSRGGSFQSLYEPEVKRHGQGVGRPSVSYRMILTQWRDVKHSSLALIERLWAIEEKERKEGDIPSTLFTKSRLEQAPRRTSIIAEPPSEGLKGQGGERHEVKLGREARGKDLGRQRCEGQLIDPWPQGRPWHRI